MTGIWTAIAIGGSSILGGVMANKNAKENAATAQNMSEADKKYNREQAEWALKQNRPTQTNSFGKQEWTTDEQGRPVQTTTMNPQDQARLDMLRSIYGQRLGAAGSINLSQYSQPTDYGAINPQWAKWQKAAQGPGYSPTGPLSGTSPGGELQQQAQGTGQLGGPMAPSVPQAPSTPTTPAGGGTADLDALTAALRKQQTDLDAQNQLGLFSGQQ